MDPVFSVVINTFNRGVALRSAILGVSQLRHRSYELIVVNGPSTDETGQVLREFAHLITHTQIAERNLSVSRNVGVQLARGRFVALIDDDSVPEPTWLDALESCFEDPQVAIAGGFIRDHTGVAYQCRVTCCDPMGDAQHFDSLHAAWEFLEKHPYWYLAATGTNVAYRKSALVDIGAFDETFEYFLEETDVILRLLRAGHRIAITNWGDVHHKFAPSHLRDVQRRSTNLRVPAQSKAYFAVHHAHARVGAAGAFQYLAHFYRQQLAHVVDCQRRNLIDTTECQEQINLLKSGLSDGIRKAFARGRQLPPPAVRINDTSGGSPDLGKSSRPLRVVFLSQQYDQLGAGGIAAWTRSVCEGLVRRGVEASVITRSDSQARIDFVNGVWVHRIAPHHQMDRTVPELPDLPQSVKDYAYSVLDELVRIKMNRGVDIVWHPIWDLEGIAVHRSGMFTCMLWLQTTFLLSVDSHPEWTANPDYFRNHIAKMIAGEKVMLQEAPRICTISEAILRDLEDGYETSLKDRSCLVPLGIPDLPYRADLSAHGDCPVVSYMGRFELRKGIDILLEAAAHLYEKGLKFRLQLLGGNVENELWQVFAERHRHAPWLEQIEVCGIVTEERKIELLMASDIFVAPSRYESFGLIYLEAQRLGLPCIGSNIGGIPEVIDETTGALVPMGDAPALAEALECLLRDRPLRESFAVAARRRFEAHFTDERVIDQLFALHERILPERRAGT